VFFRVLGPPSSGRAHDGAAAAAWDAADGCAARYQEGAGSFGAAGGREHLRGGRRREQALYLVAFFTFAACTGHVMSA